MREHNRLFAAALFCSTLSLLSMPLSVGAAAPAAAEVVSVEGVGEYRTDETPSWSSVKVKQALYSGNYLRTGTLSRLGLLFSDHTQIRMNEKSVLRVKAVQDKSPESGKTLLQLERGRAWSQTKEIPNGLIMETPSATAAIRGTDWDLEVDENGASTITVLSGVVEFYNPYGQVTVARNEQARAEAGKAPTKMVIVRPESRVQWVTAYSVEPLRHIALYGGILSQLNSALTANNLNAATRGAILADLGRWGEAEESFHSALKSNPNDTQALLGTAYSALHRHEPAEARNTLGKVRTTDGKMQELLALGMATADIQEHDFAAATNRLQQMGQRSMTQPAAYLVQSDLMVYNGNLDNALALAQQAVQQFPLDTRGYSQLARIYLLADQSGASEAQLKLALERDPHAYDALLVQGEIARIEGDAKGALAAYNVASAIKPADDRAWHGLGVVDTEREYITQARSDLRKALELNPHGEGYQGELGTVETYANNFRRADKAFSQAMTDNPDDYVSLTGKGLMLLKRGKTEEALDSLLRAGLMEPRFARVHVYTAVAYYQLGKVRQALDELTHASTLDEKDPLPHYMASIIYSDQLRPDDAIIEARLALRLMPYLKSLNQLANNQRGTTNLGQAFASMGMEEWSRMYAQESYNPFWAGSHLFLADRYNGLFTKNSELFQGFLADPLVFGADNRFQTLITKPSHNLSTSFRTTQQSDFGNTQGVQGTSPLIEANGFDNNRFPIAYYSGYENFDLKFDEGPYKYSSATAAIGLQPVYNLGLFLFGDNSWLDTGYKQTVSGSTFDYNEKLNSNRVDFGVHYNFTPTSQLWFKAGTFYSDDSTSGTIGDTTYNYPQDFTIETTVNAPEYAVRYSAQLFNDHEISLGYEQAERKTSLAYDIFDLSTSILMGFPINFVIGQEYSETSRDTYISDRYTATTKLLLQMDLFYQSHDRTAHELDEYRDSSGLSLYSAPYEDQHTYNRVSPRAGLVYKWSPTALLRIAYQDWVRPASQGSLGPVATAGIPLDDRMVMRGGELRRLRGQFEWELYPETFANLFWDRKTIDNNMFTITTPFTISELESLSKLRSRDIGALTRDDPLEFVNTPEYQAGEINSAGLSANHLLSKHMGMFASYIYTHSKNTGANYFGNMLPYIPKHTEAVGATWTDPDGWYFVARLTHRSERYTNEENTTLRKADVSGAADLYWQSPTRMWLMRFSVDDAFSKNQGTQYTGEINFRF